MLWLIGITWYNPLIMPVKRDTTLGLDMSCGITQGRDEVSTLAPWLKAHELPSPDFSVVSGFKLSILHVLEYTLTVGAQNRTQVKGVISQLKDMPRPASNHPIEIKTAGAHLVHRNAPYGSREVVSILEIPDATHHFAELRERTQQRITAHLGLDPGRWKERIGIGIVMCRASSFKVAQDRISPLFEHPECPQLPDVLTVATPAFNVQRPETV